MKNLIFILLTLIIFIFCTTKQNNSDNLSMPEIG